MNIHFIGARGYPASYASAEDLIREIAPRFVQDGHDVTVHCWQTDDTSKLDNNTDSYNGVSRVFHSTPGGKVSGQFIVALKSTLHVIKSDCDLVHYQYINSGIFCFLPKLFGKKVVINVNGQMWKDPKWPWGVRHLFFNLGAIWCLVFADQVITDSFHMSKIYRRRFFIRTPYIGYGCQTELPQRRDIHKQIDLHDPYYFIMSRITPHNLTDNLVDGFIQSGTNSYLLIAGHTPDTPWFHQLVKRAQGHRVRFLGLVKDQELLDQLILNCRAYLHGHSLGGINPALVRVVGMDKPVIAVDTVFNREVLQPDDKGVHGLLFLKEPRSVAEAIEAFERSKSQQRTLAAQLGKITRTLKSWDQIYVQYRDIYMKVIA